MGIDLADIDARLEAFGVPETRLQQVRRDAVKRMPADVDGLQAVLDELAEGLEPRSFGGAAGGAASPAGRAASASPPVEDASGGDAALDEVLELDSMELESVELDSVELEAAELTSAELGSLENELSDGRED